MISWLVASTRSSNLALAQSKGLPARFHFCCMCEASLGYLLRTPVFVKELLCSCCMFASLNFQFGGVQIVFHARFKSSSSSCSRPLPSAVRWLLWHTMDLGFRTFKI